MIEKTPIVRPPFLKKLARSIRMKTGAALRLASDFLMEEKRHAYSSPNHGFIFNHKPNECAMSGDANRNLSDRFMQERMVCYACYDETQRNEAVGMLSCVDAKFSRAFASFPVCQTCADKAMSSEEFLMDLHKRRHWPMLRYPEFRPLSSLTMFAAPGDE